MADIISCHCLPICKYTLWIFPMSHEQIYKWETSCQSACMFLICGTEQVSLTAQTMRWAGRKVTGHNIILLQHWDTLNYETCNSRNGWLCPWQCYPPNTTRSWILSSHTVNKQIITYLANEDYMCALIFNLVCPLNWFPCSSSNKPGALPHLNLSIWTAHYTAISLRLWITIHFREVCLNDPM